MKGHRAQITDCCIVDCTVASTGPRGGDAGHGGVSYVEISSIGAAMDCMVDGLRQEGVTTVRLTVYGDAEARSLLTALEFAARKLRDAQINPVEPDYIIETSGGADAE